MISEDKKNQQGFVALMTVIVISAVLMVMMVAAAGMAFRSRFTALDYENKKISVGLAEACVQTAMLEIAKDGAYPGNETVAVEPAAAPPKECRVCNVSPAGCPAGYGGTQCWKIYARAKYGTQSAISYSFTNLKTIVGKLTSTAADVDIVGWQELEYDPAEFGTCLP